MKKALSINEQPELHNNFVIILETGKDQWRERLDLFFDENEIGMDHMRYLIDISEAHLDHYYFINENDGNHLLANQHHDHLQPRNNVPNSLNTCLVDFTMDYEGARCFRYALP